MNIILWSTQKINLPESTSQNLALLSYFHNLFSIFSLLNTLDNLCVPQGQEKTCFLPNLTLFYYLRRFLLCKRELIIMEVHTNSSHQSLPYKSLV